MSKIHIITPIITRGIRTEDDSKPFLRPDLEVSYSLLDIGPATIESEVDEALAVPDTIKKAIEAENNGADAIIIDCMGDPGLNACREAVSIPVIGPCQTSIHFAAMLGGMFSFITVLDRLRPMIKHIISGYGLEGSYASFEAVNVAVLDIEGSLEQLNIGLTEKSIKAVTEDHAGAIVLGCTGFLGCAEEITKGLLAKGINVPVIDPIPLAIHVADTLIKTGLTHSKSVYPFPGKKKRVGFDIPDFNNQLN
ncbi:MAG: hydrogenase expression protein HupH [Gammaproteobacteria bacterium]|nr:MAG: hydrogenase expression protein HupH [Gammaproteobacteria bacterium]